MNHPKVTVLMPVYNAEKYLAEAIDSVLSQTFRDFELLIINDGSTDKSREIIQSFNDARIRLVENEANLLLIATLNKGIELSLGKYIARMDADDVCLPQRLEKQVALMDAHPEVGLCGSYMVTIGLEKNYEVRFATDSGEIKFRLFFDTHFPHPAAMIRRSVLMQHHLRFEKEYIHAEDFKMWNRMADVCKLAMLPEVLVKKRSHDEQISAVHMATQDKISRKIREELFEQLGVRVGVAEMDVYEDFLKEKMPKEKTAVGLLLNLFEKSMMANNDSKKYNRELFNRYFSKKYWQICAASTHLGWWIFKKYRDSVFYREGMIQETDKGKFLLKSLLRYSNE